MTAKAADTNAPAMTAAQDAGRVCLTTSHPRHTRRSIVLHTGMQIYGSLLLMRIGDLTKKQVLSIACPTCNVAAGHRCVLQAGGLRREPHTDRKRVAAEVVERERTPKKRVSRVAKRP
jgi:hypothetical protein